MSAATIPLECDRCGDVADHSTVLCCSSHKRVLCHFCYRVTHFVEVCPCQKCKDPVCDE
jgi:hypothetical protein